MERDGDQLSTRPALETEGLRFLHVTGESARAAGQRVCAATVGAPPCSVSRSPLPSGPDLAESRMLALHAGPGGVPKRAWRPSQSGASSDVAVGPFLRESFTLCEASLPGLRLLGSLRPWRLPSSLSPSTPYPHARPQNPALYQPSMGTPFYT